MDDWKQAIQTLAQGQYTCVICREGVLYTSVKRGVAPLVEWLSSGADLRRASAADKIVGKAAAMLLVLAGVKQVFAPVMSESALDVFTEYGIKAACQTPVQQIINRTGIGPCPMEQAVCNIQSPEAALQAIQRTIERLAAVQ